MKDGSKQKPQDLWKQSEVPAKAQAGCGINKQPVSFMKKAKTALCKIFSALLDAVFLL